jgi:hypothetical protein
MMAVTKDPAAVLDYLFDWSDWLVGDGDTIASHSVTVPSGITMDSSSRTTTAVTVWISGGVVGQTYEIDCHITTAGGRQDSRKMEIHVMDK